MPITEEIVAAFLKCKTKAYLKHSGTPGAQSEFSLWRQHQREEYRESCRELLCSALHTSSFAGTPNLQSLKDRRHHLVLDYMVAEGEIHARLDALMLSLVRRARLDCPYIPIRFVPSEKLSMNDKLLLAFDAVPIPGAPSTMAIHWRRRFQGAPSDCAGPCHRRDRGGRLSAHRFRRGVKALDLSFASGADEP